MPTKHSKSILELAKRGASLRFAELKAELAALAKMFPHLRYGAAVSPAMPDAVEEGTLGRRRRGRPKWSSAQRKAAALRMKKYWATRKAKGKK
jgi:hypothetical protein